LIHDLGKKKGDHPPSSIIIMGSSSADGCRWLIGPDIASGSGKWTDRRRMPRQATAHPIPATERRKRLPSLMVSEGDYGLYSIFWVEVE